MGEVIETKPSGSAADKKKTDKKETAAKSGAPAVKKAKSAK